MELPPKLAQMLSDKFTHSRFTALIWGTRWMCAALLFCTVSLAAQLPSNNLADYQAAREGLHLMKNEAGLLPLQGLDTLRPLLLSIGMDDDTELYNTLNTYVPTGRLIWQRHEQPITEWPAPLPAATPHNVVIIAIDYRGLQNSGFSFQQLLLHQNIPTIYLAFGKSPDVPTDGKNIHAKISSLQATSWAQSLAAQLIFGAVGTNNRTDSSSSEDALSGNGLHLAAINRLAFAPPAALGMDADLLKDSIKAIVNDGLAYAAFPGAQVLIANKGTIVYHETFGHHTEANKRPVQRTDLYDLASVTKITSALPALMKWYGENDFLLDAPLKNYYPAAAGTNKADLPFRAMLSHHARLRPWIPYWQGTLRGNGKYPWSKARDPERINDYRFRWCTLRRDSSRRFPVYLTDNLWQHRNYRQRMMKAIIKSSLEEKTEYRYSGLLFYLLPDIVTMKTGVPYEDYLQATFYRPLGAHSLGFQPARRFPLERIIPTERDSFFRMQLLHGYVHDEGAAMMNGLSANAGLFSSAYDLAKLMQMYLNGGTYGDQRYLTQTALDTFTTRHYAADDNHRGLGFDKPLLEYDANKSSVAKAASDSSFGHAGYTGTFVWADPEQELLFIFLSNRVYPSRSNRGIYTRNIRPRIHTVIYEAL